MDRRESGNVRVRRLEYEKELERETSMKARKPNIASFPSAVKILVANWDTRIGSNVELQRPAAARMPKQLR